MTPDNGRDDEAPIAALSTLEPAVEPPDTLEARIRGDLRALGVLRRPGTARSLAAAAALLALGFLAGILAAGRLPSTAPAGDQYVLFLLGSVPGPEAERVEEYGAWARSAREQGRRLVGERLAPEAVVLGTPREDAASAVTGYFVFTAASPEDAAALARSHPHLAHGGTLVLRRIAPS
jgi:hypothetical protein